MLTVNATRSFVSFLVTHVDQVVPSSFVFQQKTQMSRLSVSGTHVTCQTYNREAFCIVIVEYFRLKQYF
eukprot:m.267567 g.267567  ORF g.267567 m.267567 type:complete len:69 (-) comp15642_c0_seq4:393-599(-)